MVQKDVLESFKRVEQRQIYKVVTDDFAVDGNVIDRSNKKVHRRTLLNNGEYIEIRYFSPCHFRTTDNLYFSTESENIQKHCTPVGYIWGNVDSANTAQLSDIVRLGLYYKYTREVPE